MSSTASAKRIKLVKENEFKNKIAESGFHSEIDLSSTTANDFSLPAVKRKSPAPRRASLQQISLNFTAENTQQSSGYSSLLSSSSTSNITTTGSTSSLTRQSRTPKKRKSEVTESDENFYNSFQFVSPVKIRRLDVDDKNCAKLVLKEKCSSENVILSSTPIRTNNTTKWGKFRSFHPEKLHSGKSLELTDNKIFCTPPIKSIAEDSINLSNIDFSNLSGNFTNSNIQQDIPANLHNLWTDDIKQSKSVSLSASISTSESQVKSVQSTFLSSIDSSKSIERRNFFNGRTKFDILGTLHSNNDIAVSEILSLMDDATLVSLSHVCKEYSNMIKDNKQYNTKRLNYLKKCRAIKENKVPSKRKALNFTIENENLSDSSIRDKKKKKAFGHYNINISLTKQKTPSPPQSPSSRRFSDFQKVKI
jgi:hypothetical protein